MVFLSVAVALASPVAVAESASLDTVESVDLDRYLGKWFEIARYPAWFQKNCTASTAEYSLRDDGAIQVINRCRKGGLDGKPKTAKGKATIVDRESNAKLKVSFFWPFKGDYWIIDLDEEYRWVVIGEPKRKYLWILSRTPEMEEEVYRSILSRLPDQGYDPSRLNLTEQPEQDPYGRGPS